MRTAPSQEGFSLIELLVTLAVAAILFAAAMPAMRTLVQNGRASTQANSLVLSLNYALSEAIKRDLPGGVTVCASANQLTCSGTSAWSEGWIVQSRVGDPPLQASLPLSGANRLTEAGDLSAITFLPSGLVSSAAAFTLCDGRGGTYARAVELSASGRIATSPTRGRSLAGAALSCP